MELRDREQKLRTWKQQYGDVRPPIAFDFKGKKLVVSGSRVHYANVDQWRFIPDFLMNYLPVTLGKEWGDAELKKPFQEQHPIVQWRTKTLEYMGKQKKEENGSYSAVASGFMAAFLSLAWDIYVVQDNGRLDSSLLERLKHKEQFQGARHELFAEATCLRAGYSIVHENEKDGRTRHAEFSATHKETGQKISVEAKSRHRPGVLGYPGVPKAEDKMSLRFGQLLNDAINKQPPYPLVVFIDTNLPASIADRVYAPASINPFSPSRVINQLLEQTNKNHGGTDPCNLVVFTNHPHHYSKDEELDPKSHNLSIMAQIPQKKPTHPLSILKIHEAACLYGCVPNEFPQIK